MLVFLALNGIELAYTQEELSSIILRVAAGEAGATELLKWLIDHEETGSVKKWKICLIKLLKSQNLTL